MVKRLFIVTVVVATLGLSTAYAQAPAYDSPYKEGSVWDMAFVRVQPGMLWDYIRSLKSEMGPMEEAKKQGLILSYRIVSTTASTADDWDVLIITEYKDMAALDGLEAKMEAIATKAGFTEAKDKATMVKRQDIRRIIGDKLGRELLVK